MSVNVTAYRGEHGARDPDLVFQSRLGSLSFGSLEAAKTYATSPNRQSDSPIEPRVYKVDLIISNPVLNNPGDPFIDAKDIRSKLGDTKTVEILRALLDHVAGTDNWYRMKEELEMDDIDDSIAFEDMVQSHIDYLLDEVYVDCYPVFDNKEWVSWFQDAGYDGLVHSGNGETAMQAEYKVFDSSQVRIIKEIDLSARHELSAEVSL